MLVLPDCVVYKILSYLPVEVLLSLNLSETDYRAVYREIYGGVARKWPDCCWSSELLLRAYVVEHVVERDLQQHQLLLRGNSFKLVNDQYVLYTGLRRYFAKNKILKCLVLDEGAAVHKLTLATIVQQSVSDNYAAAHCHCCMSSSSTKRLCLSLNIVELLKGQTTFGPSFVFFNYMDHYRRKLTNKK